MWLQLGNIALGTWLLVAPAVLPSTGSGAQVDHIVGPMVIWVAVLALRTVTRPFRLLNVLSGIGLLLGSWLAPYTGPLTYSSVLAGWAIIILSIPRGPTHQRVGDGWSAICLPWRVNDKLDADR